MTCPGATAEQVPQLALAPAQHTTSSEARPWGHLHTSVFAVILAHVPLSDAPNLRLVCRSWLSMTNENLAHLVPPRWPCTTDTPIATTFPSLRSLTLSSSNPDDAWHSDVSCLHDLTLLSSLTLSPSEPTAPAQRCLKLWRRLLRRLPYLQQLVIHNCPAFHARALSSLARPHLLTHLELSKSSVTTRAVHVIGAACGGLRHLSLSHCALRACPLSDLSSLTRLTTLILSQVDHAVSARSSGNSNLCRQGLSALTALEHLSLARFPWVNAAVLAEVATLAGLTSLDLSAPSREAIAHGALADLSLSSLDPLCHLRRLQVLILCDVRTVPDTGFAFLASLVRLTHLEMSGTEFGDVASSAVVGLPRLERLRLEGCASLTDRHLAMLGASCRRLTDARLADCPKVSFFAALRLTMRTRIRKLPDRARLGPSSADSPHPSPRNALSPRLTCPSCFTLQQESSDLSGPLDADGSLRTTSHAHPSPGVPANYYRATSDDVLRSSMQEQEHEGAYDTLRTTQTDAMMRTGLDNMEEYMVQSAREVPDDSSVSTRGPGSIVDLSPRQSTGGSLFPAFVDRGRPPCLPAASSATAAAYMAVGPPLRAHPRPPWPPQSLGGGSASVERLLTPRSASAGALQAGPSLGGPCSQPNGALDAHHWNRLLPLSSSSSAQRGTADAAVQRGSLHDMCTNPIFSDEDDAEIRLQEAFMPSTYSNPPLQPLPSDSPTSQHKNPLAVIDNSSSIVTRDTRSLAAVGRMTLDTVDDVSLGPGPWVVWTVPEGGPEAEELPFVRYSGMREPTPGYLTKGLFCPRDPYSTRTSAASELVTSLWDTGSRTSTPGGGWNCHVNELQSMNFAHSPAFLSIKPVSPLTPPSAHDVGSVGDSLTPVIGPGAPMHRPQGNAAPSTSAPAGMPHMGHVTRQSVVGRSFEIQPAPCSQPQACRLQSPGASPFASLTSSPRAPCTASPHAPTELPRSQAELPPLWTDLSAVRASYNQQMASQEPVCDPAPDLSLMSSGAGENKGIDFEGSGLFSEVWQYVCNYPKEACGVAALLLLWALFIPVLFFVVLLALVVVMCSAVYVPALLSYVGTCCGGPGLQEDAGGADVEGVEPV